MTINQEVKRLLNEINDENTPRDLKVKEKLFSSFSVDPTTVIIDHPERKFNWKYFAGELYWYLLKDRKIEEISHYSSFWKKLTNIDGTVNSNYGALYIGDQFKWVYESLKRDKNTRQAIALYNRPEYQYSSNKDFICTLYTWFYIKDDTLNMKAQMRSSDLFYGISYDAPWFGTVLQSLYLNLKPLYPTLKLGTYYHHSDNLHFYERHFKLAEVMKKTDFNQDITMWLKEPLFSLEGMQLNYSDDVNKFISEMRDLKGKDTDYKKVLESIYHFDVK